MITPIGGHIMLAIWRSGITGCNILRIALCCLLRNYQTPKTITLDACWSRQMDDGKKNILFPSRHHPCEPELDWGARGVKRGARRLLGGWARGGWAPTPPDMGRGGYADPGRGGERDEGSGGCGRGDLRSSDHVDPFHNPDLGFSSFQAPSPPGTGSSSFQALPPPGTVGSSTLYMPISTVSSSDTDEHDDEQTDVMTPAQQLGFGHRVGKNTTRVL
ncbi:hypothetical protein M9H77_13501 [Catharanthus roseus]|uniref:Uncharacterized protein n=1 Tax=Catharanthus roseus TaxID=4058 RepID=A0ACC0BKL3_CATRO|nr:hypothetical protein M9H77_13501 [Catharanthus roseus]